MGTKWSEPDDKTPSTRKSKVLPGTKSVTIESSILDTVSTWQKQSGAFVQRRTQPILLQRGLKSPKIRRILSSQLHETKFRPASAISSTPEDIKVCIDKIALADRQSCTNGNDASLWSTLVEDGSR